MVVAAAAVWAEDGSMRAKRADKTEATMLVFMIDAEGLENMLRLTVGF